MTDSNVHTRDIKQSLAFISTLEIPETPNHLKGLKGRAISKQLTADGDDGSAEVNGGSIIAFTAGLDDGAAADVSNSFLLAQLAADHKYDRELKTKEWYTFYIQVLTNVGWVIQDFDFTKYDISGASVKIDKVVMDVLGTMLTGSEAELLKSAIDAFKVLDEESKAASVFEHSSDKSNKGNFQLVVASETNGKIAAKIGAFQLTADIAISKLFWMDFSSTKSQIYKSAQVIFLDDAVYSRVRTSIVTKLGDHAVNYVDDLEIDVK